MHTWPQQIDDMNVIEIPGEAIFLADRLWRVIRASGFSKDHPSGNLLHVKRVFDQEWLESLPLAIGENKSAEQKVTLLNGADLERRLHSDEVEAAYASLPRTRVCENLGEFGGGWVKSVEVLLAAATGFSVGSSAYESNAGDTSLHPHFDHWTGVILQFKGSKLWRLRPNGQGSPRQILTEAGDVLLMPPTVEHEVSTPGHSVHINFEIFTSEPLPVAG